MYVARTSNNRVISMEWSWWVTSHNACEPGEQFIVLANGDDESDLVGWSLLLLAATVRSSAHMPLGISDRNTRSLHELWKWSCVGENEVTIDSHRAFEKVKKTCRNLIQRWVSWSCPVVSDQSVETQTRVSKGHNGPCLSDPNLRCVFLTLPLFVFVVEVHEKRAECWY